MDHVRFIETVQTFVIQFNHLRQHR